MINRYIIFILQILAYLSLIPMIIYGSIQHYLVAFFFYFLFNGIGMIMIYHRLLSHRIFNPPKVLEYIGAFLATFSITGSAITWVAMHRQHHAYSDTEKDPHSPDILGWFKVQFTTVFADIKGKYAVDLMRDKFYLWQHKNYLWIILGYSLLLFFIDPFAVVYLFLFPAGLSLWFGTLILSLCHKDYKPRSLFWLGIITFGDAFHAEHHNNPKAIRLHKYDFVGFLIEKYNSYAT